MSQVPLIQQLTEYDTALIANTIGFLDPTPAHEWYMGGSIGSLTPSFGPTVGVAMTCEVDTSTPNSKPSMDHYYALLEEIEKCEDPVVMVAKVVGSRPDHECVIGDGMAKMLRSVGCVGLVTDGGVRDLEGILTVPFAVYARGKTIHHCALRFTSHNQPVEIGGINVRPGDMIHANAGGVIKIPAQALSKLPDACARMRSFEHEVHLAWRQDGLTIKQKRDVVAPILAKYGFTK